jgi:hypothetical protein
VDSWVGDFQKPSNEKTAIKAYFRKIDSVRYIENTRLPSATASPGTYELLERSLKSIDLEYSRYRYF